MIAKFAKILRVTGVKTRVRVLIFDVNRSRVGVKFCNFGSGLDSESQKSDSGHLCSQPKISGGGGGGKTSQAFPRKILNLA